MKKYLGYRGCGKDFGLLFSVIRRLAIQQFGFFYIFGSKKFKKAFMLYILFEALNYEQEETR